MLQVLHVFNEYLPKTEVWAFQLIQACSKVDHLIFADYYTNLEHFEKNVTLLHRKSGLIKKKRAEISQYDFPYNLFEPLVVISDIFSSPKRLKPLIQKHKIDLIHFHFGTTAVSKWNELADIDLPFIVSFYGWDYQKAIYYNPGYRDIYKAIFKKAAVIIVEGSYGGAKLVENDASLNKLKTLPLGISISQKPHKKSFRQNGILRLIQIASLSEKKGQKYTIEAFEKACSISPTKIELTIVGDDREKYYAEELRKSIKEKGLEDLIDLKEWIDFEKIDSFLLDYDIFIHPSVHAKDGDCEGGSPVILLHAQAIGLPIISTRHCDIPEQVLHEKTGFLAAERDVDTIAKYIVDFASMNDQEYFELSRNCVNFVNETFDVNKIGLQLNSIYTELLK